MQLHCRRGLKPRLQSASDVHYHGKMRKSYIGRVSYVHHRKFHTLSITDSISSVNVSFITSKIED